MKIKNDHRKNDKSAIKPASEEFFKLPRAEYLIENLRDGRIRQIGDLVTNSSRQLANRFTLEATDDDMKGADIRKGDYMVIEKKTSYMEGSIVAVQLGNRQIIRRYFRTSGRIHLQCDPPSKQIIVVEEHTPDFRILGQVIQIIREIKPFEKSEP
jgi:SOS-response transcriptional repressor LexA